MRRLGSKQSFPYEALMGKEVLTGLQVENCVGNRTEQGSVVRRGA